MTCTATTSSTYHSMQVYRYVVYHRYRTYCRCSTHRVLCYEVCCTSILIPTPRNGVLTPTPCNGVLIHTPRIGVTDTTHHVLVYWYVVE